MPSEHSARGSVFRHTAYSLQFFPRRGCWTLGYKPLPGSILTLNHNSEKGGPLLLPRSCWRAGQDFLFGFSRPPETTSFSSSCDNDSSWAAMKLIHFPISSERRRSIAVLDRACCSEHCQCPLGKLIVISTQPEAVGCGRRETALTARVQLCLALSPLVPGPAVPIPHHVQGPSLLPPPTTACRPPPPQGSELSFHSHLVLRELSAVLRDTVCGLGVCKHSLHAGPLQGQHQNLPLLPVESRAGAQWN